MTAAPLTALAGAIAFLLVIAAAPAPTTKAWTPPAPSPAPYARATIAPPSAPLHTGTTYRATALAQHTPRPLESIESELRERLAANGFGDVGVSVDAAGRAYIEGSAADFDQKQQIENIVRGVAGVRSVTSSLDLPKGWMGVTVASGAGGATVQYVMRGAPADTAGIAVNDVIVAIDGDPIRDYSDFHRAIETKVVGQTITVTLQHDGQTMNVTVTLRRKPFRNG